MPPPWLESFAPTTSSETAQKKCTHHFSTMTSVSTSIDQLACILREHRSPDSLVVLPLLLAAAVAFGPGTFTELGARCAPRPHCLLSLSSCSVTALAVCAQVLLMVKAARRRFTWNAALAGGVSFSKLIPPTTRR